MSNSIWEKPTVRPVKDCIVVWQNPARTTIDEIEQLIKGE